MFNQDLFKSKVDSLMKTTAPDSYRYCIANQDSILGSGSGGFSRIAIDPPLTKATVNDRFNIASTSKTITAAAVLNLLQAKNLPVDTLVARFLPSDWKLHPNVQLLTFRDFLTHRSGFSEAGDRTDFAGIKLSLEEGPANPIKSAADYRNINFAIFRIIIPLLRYYNRFTKSFDIHIVRKPMNEYYANEYISFVQKNVLEPSGVAGVGCDSRFIKDTSGTPKSVLLYQYNHPPQKHGEDVYLGDRSLVSGSESWCLSVIDYAKFLQTLLFTEIIISEKQRKDMFAEEVNSHTGFGLDRVPDVAQSRIFLKGGWMPYQGRVEIASWWAYFERNNLLVTALSNSWHKDGPNWFNSTVEAYGQSWQVDSGGIKKG